MKHMGFNFDKITDRKGTNCIKYDFAIERGMPENVLPLWVADMDFPTVPEVIEDLKKAVSNGIFGYSEAKSEYFKALSEWYEKYFDWKLKPNWLVKTPGVVFGIAMAVKAFTNEGDSVIIQQPVYYPFKETIEDNNRVVVNNSLKNVNGHYEIDFEDFERKVKENNVKLFILCSPHNPVGRVWKKWELEKLGDICVENNVTVVSDEIHSDFVYPGNKHTAFANIKEEFQNITVTCTAPSKTFNLAGLQVSNIIIPNDKLRKKFRKQISAAGYSQVNALGLVACESAYRNGRQWLDSLKEYLIENINFVRDYLEENIPSIKLIEPEGTYLIWLDFCELGLENEELEDLIINKSGLWLDSGAIFGEDGKGYQRINIACPRKTLEQALNQLKSGIDSLK